MLYTLIQQKANTTKATLLNFRQKALNQVFVQVTGDITVNTKKNDTYVAFKNCAQFSRFKTEINKVLIDKANHVYIAMPALQFDLIYK